MNKNKHTIFLLLLVGVLLGAAVFTAQSSKKVELANQVFTPALAVPQENNKAPSLIAKNKVSKKKIKKEKKSAKFAQPQKKPGKGLPGLCDSQSSCLSYCMTNRQACLDYCEKDNSKTPLCAQLTNILPKDKPSTGSKTDMMEMMMKMQGGGFGGFGEAGAGTSAVFDPTKEPLPKIAVANFIDLDWQVQRISKFRGGYGHDYSFGTGEVCRSMKHYFWAKGGDPGQPHDPKWMTIALYAPADGIIERVQISNNTDGPEAQFSIAVDANKAFKFGFHHVRLEQGLTNGSQVKAGQKLGTIGNENNHGEIAVEITTPRGRSLVSFFEVASDEVLKAYAARGLTDIKNAIYTKEERDAKPLICDKNTVEGRFTGGSEGDSTTDSAGMANWFELN